MTQPNKITLDFTAEELAVIDAALGELPFKLAAPLVESINRQLRALRPEVEDSDQPQAQDPPQQQ